MKDITNGGKLFIGWRCRQPPVHDKVAITVAQAGEENEKAKVIRRRERAQAPSSAKRRNKRKEKVRV